jgi:hypothetical protein
MTDTTDESVEIPENKGESHDLTEAVTESHNWELAGVTGLELATAAVTAGRIFLTVNP